MISASVIACAFGLGACGSNGSSAAPQRVHSRTTHPVEVIPGPEGLLAGAQPQPNGQMWVLSDSSGSKTIQSVGLVTRQGRTDRPRELWCRRPRSVEFGFAGGGKRPGRIWVSRFP